MIQFLTTTKLDRIPADQQIIMVDGTVPGWSPKEGDLHFDHHRPGGSKIQIDDFNDMFPEISDGACIVTTQTDADACVAAAWLLWQKYLEKDGHKPYPLLDFEIMRRLRAIAFDCDYLYVPPDLDDLADFAAQAVAALKSTGNTIANDLSLPVKREEWDEYDREIFYSCSFRLGTEWLIAACRGERKFPGEEGEAAQYWGQVEKDILMLSDSRIEIYRAVPIADLIDIKRYVDPRAFYRAVGLGWNISKLSPLTLVAQPRKENDGIRYTLGTNPAHPSAATVDYSSAKVWEALSREECKRNSKFQGWGGRAAVGGSSWNDPSLLNPHEVIDIVLQTLIEADLKF